MSPDYFIFGMRNFNRLHCVGTLCDAEIAYDDGDAFNASGFDDPNVALTVSSLIFVQFILLFQI